MAPLMYKMLCFNWSFVALPLLITFCVSSHSDLMLQKLKTIRTRTINLAFLEGKDLKAKGFNWRIYWESEITNKQNVRLVPKVLWGLIKFSAWRNRATSQLQIEAMCADSAHVFHPIRAEVELQNSTRWTRSTLMTLLCFSVVFWWQISIEVSSWPFLHVFVYAQHSVSMGRKFCTQGTV